MTTASITREAVLAALSKVQEPELGGDLVTRGMIRDIIIEGNNLTFTVVLTTPACPLKNQIQKECEDALHQALPTLGAIKVNWDADMAVAHRGGGHNHGGTAGAAEPLLPGVKNIIAVSSGKGGVGKSTVSVNMAVALAQEGARVGLLDADIYGPNIPIMMGGLNVRPHLLPNNRFTPVENYGVKMMSIGFLVPPGASMIWRGPMVHGALQQLMRDCEWGPLDYFIIDMPPGTGDAQLSIAQSVQLAGAVIVSTPQDVAFGDAIRGLAMFQQIHVPILGMIENMSFFVCPHCGMHTDIFDHGHVAQEAKRRNMPFPGRDSAGNLGANWWR